MLVGVPVSLVANAAVIFAVVQSPYGSLGFFDDSPSTSDWLLPMASGAAIGLLEALAFRARTTLIADGLTVLLGLISFLFIFPVANYAIGCALGAGVATAVSRCLGLVEASVDGGTDGGTVLVVWRLGTSVSSDPFRLTVDGRTYGLGDKVTVPGAGLLTPKRDLEAYRPNMPASCAGHEVFL